MPVEKIDFEALPDLRELPLKVRKRARFLLLTLAETEGLLKSTKKRSDDAKDELVKLQETTGIAGFQSDGFAFIAREMPGKRSLDKALLIENGVTPEVIEQSMKPGKSYTERRFKVLSEKDSKESED